MADATTRSGLAVDCLWVWSMCYGGVGGGWCGWSNAAVRKRRRRCGERHHLPPILSPNPTPTTRPRTQLPQGHVQALAHSLWYRRPHLPSFFQSKKRRQKSSSPNKYHHPSWPLPSSLSFLHSTQSPCLLPGGVPGVQPRRQNLPLPPPSQRPKKKWKW